MSHRIAEARRQRLVRFIVELVLAAEEHHLVTDNGGLDGGERGVIQAARQLHTPNFRANAAGYGVDVEGRGGVFGVGIGVDKAGHGNVLFRNEMVEKMAGAKAHRHPRGRGCMRG